MVVQEELENWFLPKWHPGHSSNTQTRGDWMRVEEGEGEGDSDRLTPPGDRLETRCSTVPSEWVGMGNEFSLPSVNAWCGEWN